MVKLGTWLILAAVALMILALLPAWLGVGEETSVVADFVFCDNVGQAAIHLNLSEAALAKGSLGSVFSGSCILGSRSTPIDPQRLMNLLTAVGVAVITGLMFIFIGVMRRSDRTPAMGSLVGSTGANPSSGQPVAQKSPPQAQDMRTRDRDDAQARREANVHRQTIATPTATYTPRSTSTPDWQLGMPSNSAPEAPSERFSFSRPQPGQLSADLQTQLNLLQLAYESSLITRSEYDAKRDALLGTAH